MKLGRLGGGWESSQGALGQGRCAKVKGIIVNLTWHLFLLGCETTTNGLLSRFLFLGKALLQRG